MGDIYWYQNGVKLSIAGGAYDHQTGTYCGPFAFDVYEAINATPLYLGSSGILNNSINVGDHYWYQDGIKLYMAGGSYIHNTYCGPFAFASLESITFSAGDVGFSGIREYSSMSSQVPTESNAWISDIAFESNYPYSLHPTAVNDSINVGDHYWYQRDIRLSIAGGSYFDSAACSGPLTFSLNEVPTVSREDFGSSGIREYSSMSSQVPTTTQAWVSDIAFESSYPYSLHPTAVNDDINVGDQLVYQSRGITALAGGCYYDREGNRNGYLAFNSELDISGTYEWYGSSSYIQQQPMTI